MRERWLRRVVTCMAFVVLMGCAFKVEAAHTVQWGDASSAEIATGDLNDDDKTSAEDAVVMRTVLVNDWDDEKYDLTGDGLIDSRDLIRLKKLIGDAPADNGSSDKLLEDDDDSVVDWGEPQD